MTNNNITRLVNVISQIERMRRSTTLGTPLQLDFMELQVELERVLSYLVETVDPTSPYLDTTPTRIIGR
jgi:hypothetical protein